MKARKFFYILALLFAIALFISSCADGGDSDSSDDDVSDDDSSDDDNDDDTDDDTDDDDDVVDTVVYVDDLPVIRLKGSAYERGYELGRVLGDKIIYLYQEYVLTYSLGLSPEFCDLYKTLKNIACALLILTDEETQQIMGLADGIKDNWDSTITLPDGSEMELNHNDICISNALADMSQMGCSSLSAWGSITEDGQTILARNLDWDPGPDRFLGSETVVISETPSDESWHFVSVGWPGLFGCYSCINGDGSAAFIHDTNRYHSGFLFSIEPRTFLLRRALLATEGANDPFEVFESELEAGKIDTGNNFHLVTANQSKELGAPAGCFEVDDNETHVDGFATLRTSFDTDVKATDLTEALFVTNHHRKRYPPSNCWRYTTMIDQVTAILNGGAEADDPKLGIDDLHWVVTQVEFNWVTVHTIVFKPSDWTFWLYRAGADHPASGDDGVLVPYETLFPW